MNIHRAYGPSPASAVLCLNDLHTTGREPRVYDLTLARVLGYEHARNVRRLIKSSRAELATHGDLVEVHDQSGGAGNLLSGGANAVTPKAGRPGRAFYLNEGQALVVCALTRTAVAARVRGELIRVFMLHRAGELRLHPAAVTRGLVPAERRALQAIVRRADVVLAPPCTVSPARRDFEATPAIGYAADGHVPYLLSPITDEILDTLAAFEADLADLEDGQDAEGGRPDEEPSLGAFGGINQKGWAGSPNVVNDGDRELDNCDDEDDDCDEDNGDKEPSLAGFYYGDSSDLERDQADDEPSLGSLDAQADQGRWSNGSVDDREASGTIDDFEMPATGEAVRDADAVAARLAAHRLGEIASRLTGRELRL